MRELFLQRAKLLIEFEELRLLLRQDVRGVHVDALGLKGAVIARRVIGVLFAVGEDARERRHGGESHGVAGRPERVEIASVVRARAGGGPPGGGGGVVGRGAIRHRRGGLAVSQHRGGDGGVEVRRRAAVGRCGVAGVRRRASGDGRVPHGGGERPIRGRARA